MIKTLLFSSLFPHRGQPSLGIFVERRLRQLLKQQAVETRVIAPVPWFPIRSKLFGDWSKSAMADQREIKNNLLIWHPRYTVIPKVGMRFTPNSLAKAGLEAAKDIIASGFKPDLIDAHYLYPDGVAAAKVAKALNLPFVLTARGSDVTEIPHYEFAKTRILKAIGQAGQVITVSESLRTGLLDMGVPPTKVTTVRNGVDPDVFKPDARDKTRSSLGLEGPTLLAAGWLIKRKRVDRVIDMLCHTPDYTLLIAGSGPEEAALRTQVDQLGLANRVRFLGRVEPENMPTIMAAADRLVLASEREGWANVLLEAMACGTPVVCTNAGGAREFVQLPGGLVSPADTPEALAETLKKLDSADIYRDETRRYALHYGWDAVSAMQYDIFEKLLAEKS